MRLNRVSILFSVMLCLLLLTVLCFQTVKHEQVHKQIGIYSGAKECQITYSIHGGLTICTGYENRSAMMALQEIALDSQNEIVGYNILSLMLTIFAGIAIMGNLYIRINDRPDFYWHVFEKKP